MGGLVVCSSMYEQRSFGSLDVTLRVSGGRLVHAEVAELNYEARRTAGWGRNRLFNFFVLLIGMQQYLR